MSDLEEIRLTCAVALKEIQEARLSYQVECKRVQRASERIQQEALIEDDQVENTLQRARVRSKAVFENASRVLEDLKLPLRGQIQQHNLPTAVEQSSVQEKIQLIERELRENESLLKEMREMAKVLVVERLKWWKFW